MSEGEKMIWAAVFAAAYDEEVSVSLEIGIRRAEMAVRDLRTYRKHAGELDPSVADTQYKMAIAMADEVLK